MRLRKLVPNFPRGVFGTFVLVPMLYAGFALVTSTPARAAGVSGEALCLHPQFNGSCTVYDDTCHLECCGVGVCCDVCYAYDCDDGSTIFRCRTECGVQCGLPPG